jgi:hypothetical protein
MSEQQTTPALFTAPVTVTSVSHQIQPPQPIPFIPMVPPLANTFSSTLTPTVTSSLVDNLINNNPTPTTLSAGATTTVTSSAFTQNVSQPTETSAMDNLATNMTGQMFVSPPNPSSDLIRSEQNVIQPPSSIPAAYQTPASQNVVQSDGE